MTRADRNAVEVAKAHQRIDELKRLGDALAGAIEDYGDRHSCHREPWDAVAAWYAANTAVSTDG